MPLDQPLEKFDLAVPLGEHLEELRRRLLWSAAGLVVAALITFPLGFRLIAWLAQPMLQALDAMGFPPQTVVLDPTAGFTTVFLPVTLIAAALLACPWIIFQIWRFVSIGLYRQERKVIYVLTPFSTIMTFAGVLFTYYILLPVSLMFFLGFANRYPPIELHQPSWFMQQLIDGYAVSPTVPPKDDATSAPQDAVPLMLPVLRTDPANPAEGSVWINASESKLKAVLNQSVRQVGLQSNRLLAPMPQLGSYVRFAAVMMLGVVAAFQLPVVMLVAGWTHLVDPRQLAKLRRYAVFVSFALGAILTPTDVFSMFVLAIPLYLLFEFGLILMRLVDRQPPPPAEL